MLALLSVGVLGGASSAEAADVLSAGPLEKVNSFPDLSCQALRSGDQDDAFFGTDACGTYVHVGSATYGPSVSAGGSTGAINYTEVSQSGVTGNGTAGSPFTVDTVVSSAGGGFSIAQRDQYVVGQERWTTSVTITNTGAPRTFGVYRGGDCYQANSDFGFGRVTGTNPACISDGGRVQELQAITPGNTYIEAFYSTMWGAIGNGGPLPNTCACATELDNAVAIGWQTTLNTGASATFDSAWFLSSPFVSFAPQRILDTRPDGVTVDGQFQQGGVIGAGQTLELQVGGRAGVAGDATSAILNVATLGASAPGYLTIYPCGVNRPNASSVNYFPGVVRSVAVYGRLDATGRLCIYALQDTHVIVDVNGYQPSSSSAFTTLTPARLLETRSGGSTVDGLFNAIGRRAAGTVTELTVAGRGNVPLNASAAILSVAGVYPDGPAFLTVWPCGEPMPTASNVNLNSVNDVVPNAVISRIGTGGNVCIFNPVGMDVIADVSGFAPAGAQYNSLTPARLLDTRSTGATIDDLFEGDGQIPAGGTLQLDVTGRGNVPSGAVAVALNVTVTGATAPGFITVWPCGTTRPQSSNLNYTAGVTTANLVMPGVGTGGQVCFYSLSPTDLVVDVSGFFPA